MSSTSSSVVDVKEPIGNDVTQANRLGESFIYEAFVEQALDNNDLISKQKYMMIIIEYKSTVSINNNSNKKNGNKGSRSKRTEETRTMFCEVLNPQKKDFLSDLQTKLHISDLSKYEVRAIAEDYGKGCDIDIKDQEDFYGAVVIYASNLIEDDDEGPSRLRIEVTHKDQDNNDDEF